MPRGRPASDYAGRTTGRLSLWTVLRRATPVGAGGGVRYVCRHSCGAEKEVSAAAIRRGVTPKCLECRLRPEVAG